MKTSDLGSALIICQWCDVTLPLQPVLAASDASSTTELVAQPCPAGYGYIAQTAACARAPPPLFF